MVCMTLKENISWLSVVWEQEIDVQETPGNAKEHTDPVVFHHNHWKQAEGLFIALCLHLYLSILIL